MKKINFRSGDNSPSNDIIRLHVAMEPDSQSNIYVHLSEGKTLLSYSTNSDYVFYVERVGRFNGQHKSINPVYSNNIGYASTGISWVPGKRIASNSEALEIPEELNAPLLSSKDYFGDEEVEKKNTIILDDYYNQTWLAAEDSITVTNIKLTPDANGRIQGQGPFLEIVEPMIFNTGEIRLYSSDLNSSVFSFEIKKDLQANITNPNYSSPTKRKIKRLNYGNKSLEGFIEEWNSIFSITNNININSTFKDGENIDDYFMQEIDSYINEEWDGKMQKYLWERGVVDSSISLSSNEPNQLRDIILKQIKNYGASDDIKIMSEKYNMNLSWHIGLGGLDYHTKSRRMLFKGESYVPDLQSFKSIYRVGGFAPRGAYFSTSQANEAMGKDVGKLLDSSGITINEDQRDIGGSY